MPTELIPDADLTLHGAAYNLLEILALANPQDPDVQGAMARLEAALRGPDWLDMAEALDLGDSSLIPCVENLLERWPTASDAEVNALLESARDALAADRAALTARIERVAQGLEAAAYHGSTTAPLERLMALKVEPGTVLCFPMSDNPTAHEHAVMQRGIQALREKVKVATGVDVPMMVVPRDRIPGILKLEAGAPPPRGVQVAVIVEGKRIVVEQRADGWHVPEALERGITLAEVTTARRLAEEGHGQPL